MRLLFFGLLLFSFSVLASEEVRFKNDREGTSLYLTKTNRRVEKKALKNVSSEDIIKVFDDVLKNQKSSTLCSFHLNSSLEQELKKITPDFNAYEGVVFHLRFKGYFDDIVTKILLRAYRIESTFVTYPEKNDTRSLPDGKTLEEAFKILSSSEKKIKEGCLEETYAQVLGSIKKFNKKLKPFHIQAIYSEAYVQKIINLETYESLERARINELEKTNLTLKEYFRKIRSLRTQFPIRDESPLSDFISSKMNKGSISRRQRLLEGYSDLQIVLMANIIKKLKIRLDSPRAEILIYDRNQDVETIELAPMERFRLAIKLLRKENSLLALNTYFSGKTPAYIDLISAAYEVGMIPASELDEVAGLEEIWSPEKTFWDKAGIWIRTLSTVSTIAIPPPFGFIPSLGLVIIEMTSGKNTNNSNDPTVLF